MSGRAVTGGCDFGVSFELVMQARRGEQVLLEGAWQLPIQLDHHQHLIGSTCECNCCKTAGNVRFIFSLCSSNFFERSKLAHFSNEAKEHSSSVKLSLSWETLDTEEPRKRAKGCSPAGRFTTKSPFQEKSLSVF